ncbi:hypothetical protein L249_6479 [Ophiocordyceps polyrhachis-furcata BCC 54312]|uniref:Uncharacterized protein n=1 Tax=Ophiocordyceps polyrhachis-furcata BCC 54312 TaxID=1330021 RepID=A0A367LK66_9HYPO|nr:hypothetical protein L249_6479 [Ophiocordyceps polyrhachis-furcata BCC 54312]
MMMSNQGVNHVIEKKKTNHVIVVFTTIEVGRYDRYWYSASIAVQRADRCDDRCNESIGRYDRYSPTVTQGVAYFLSVQDEKICVI